MSAIAVLICVADCGYRYCVYVPNNNTRSDLLLDPET